VFQK
jgi:predicted nuclease with TOPRIM domain